MLVIAESISASVGAGLRSISAAAAMIIPGMQKPHCGTLSATQACCTGWERSLRQRLDGGDEAALEIGDPDPAAAHRLAVDMDGAGAAMAGAAAIFGAGEVGRVAQRPKQGRLRVHAIVDGLPVHGKAAHIAPFLGEPDGTWKAKGLQSTREGGVAHVELAREGKFNAMDKAMFEEIGEAFRTLGADPSVRAILLSGRGRHFTAGLDLQYAASQFPPTDDPGPGRGGPAPAHQMAAGHASPPPRRRGRR